MADVKISALSSIVQNDVSGTADVLPIVDTSLAQTKKVTVDALLKGAGGFMADGSTPLSGNVDGNSQEINNLGNIQTTSLTGSGVLINDVILFSGGMASISSSQNIVHFFNGDGTPSIRLTGGIGRGIVNYGSYGWDGDSNTLIDHGTDLINFRAGGSSVLLDNAVSPQALNPANAFVWSLGRVGTPWKDIYAQAYFVSGGVSYMSGAGSTLELWAEDRLGLYLSATTGTDNVKVVIPTGSQILAFSSNEENPAFGSMEDTGSGLYITSSGAEIGLALLGVERLSIAGTQTVFSTNVVASPNDGRDLGSLSTKWRFGHISAITGSVYGRVDLSGTILQNGKPLYISSSVETTSYTLADDNHGQILLVSASALVTVPNTLSTGVQATVVNYMSGTQFRFTGSGGTQFIYPNHIYQTASSYSPRGSSVVFTVVRSGEVLVSGDLELL